eukprot:TRINITY_DN14854_c0_g1_i1.p2 TRINITY_DN14854_c0_g1~~TRINITY_DN14854_c0_g1_i1.p2  ORF type:complete len:133 (-),score=22.79 TRINITY_DN14854_c0_g1_i1:310-708(-)
MMGKGFLETVWDLAAGPDVEEVKTLEVPNSLKRFEDLKKQGMDEEKARQKAMSEFELITELDKSIVQPINKSLQTVNRNVEKNTIISWGALMGHPVFWGISNLRHTGSGEGVVKAVSTGAEALKMAISGKPE